MLKKLLPESLEQIRTFLLTAQKDSIIRNIYNNPGIVANVDETPLVIESITKTSLEKIGEKSIKVRTFNKSKQRVTCIFSVFTNGAKAPPHPVFKGVQDDTIYKRLNNYCFAKK